MNFDNMQYALCGNSMSLRHEHLCKYISGLINVKCMVQSKLTVHRTRNKMRSKNVQ